MKVKVIKDSVIYDGQIFKVDSVFELDDVIAKGLINNGNVTAFVEGEFNEIQNDVEEDSHEEQGIKTHLDADDLKTWKKDELVKLAEDMGIDSKGTKEELIAKITSVEVEIDEDSIIDEESDELPNTSMPE